MPLFSSCSALDSVAHPRPAANKPFALMGSSQSTAGLATSTHDRTERTGSPPISITEGYAEKLNLPVCFRPRAGAAVHGFPSTAGVYTLSCSGMELVFLGLDQFETALPSCGPAEDDAHLRQNATPRGRIVAKLGRLRHDMVARLPPARTRPGRVSTLHWSYVPGWLLGSRDMRGR
ncbi:uncharacterized protein B0H64DRAFT_45395 [Chaetomium fimeti]|uniref:Uncharacterized protein n=1 Tax=Chaetomium fimeti TaxID=1854472 RepID=A0AAE0H7B3_9PEZI|nr:hypothetical protein B0H64DRAFT_45395 [Chaetomium fimeti]